MDKINSVFAKWLLIAATTERELNTGRWNATTIGQLQQQINEAKSRLDLEAVYTNINAYYRIDLKIMNGQTQAHKELRDDIKEIKGNSNRKFFFMTIGFDDSKITISGIKDSICKLKELKDIDLGEYVVEKFRKDDNGKIYTHHHIHCILYTDKPKSKVIQFVYQKLKKYIVSSNFIDLKREQPIENYLKYISGDKRDEKLECVQKDNEWRQLNNL